MSIIAQRTILWFTIGGSAAAPEVRNINVPMWAGTPGAGFWTRFVEKWLRPAFTRGARRFLVHNPFGTLGAEPMQLDQAVEAKAAGLGWLVDEAGGGGGFAGAMREFLAWCLQRGARAGEVELIVYLGSLTSDRSFTGNLAAGKLDDWLTRFASSLRPALHAGGSLALDELVTAPEGSVGHRAYQLLDALTMAAGGTVYVEGRARGDFTHWHQAPTIMAESWWRASDPKNPAAVWKGGVQNVHLKGGVIRYANVPIPAFEGTLPARWQPASVRQILEDGHDAAIEALDWLREGKTTLEEWIASSSPATV